MVGGYKIIDFAGYVIPESTSPITVPGIYDAIESSYKALLIENLTIDESGTETEFKPFFATADVESGDFTFFVTVRVDSAVNILKIIVDDDDQVSYSWIVYPAD